ncbi:MAG: hypothetical protein M1143_00270 [Candidatus Thermoplasmatota archaeon]|jgi:predicted transcriptional regulator|nr:hypothetical protein [Candidatus Thermoplasmatota archaeon]
MPKKAYSPAKLVQLLQALVARELVERMGVPVRRAAQLLGIAPSAISQYLSGKRRQAPIDELFLNEAAVKRARDLATLLLEGDYSEGASVRLILEASARLAGETKEEVPLDPEQTARIRVDRRLTRQLRQRIAAEQASVSECMQLAQKARDELTRAIFRQIASDSLRHAEIVASIETYLDRGVNRTLASGITRADIERLIESERVAEAQTSGYIQKHLGGVMSLLAHSMRADERKHDELLMGLLRYGFPTPEGAAEAALPERSRKNPG